MNNAKLVSTPFRSYFQLLKGIYPQFEQEERVMAHIPYISVVGNVMYAKVCSRPNIAQMVSMVSCYMSKLGKGVWKL